METIAAKINVKAGFSDRLYGSIP